MRDYRLYLRDILDAMASIEAFVTGMTFETFQADDKTASAVVQKFMIIGEASKHIPEAVRLGYPDVPWKAMAGMRDRLIHDYLSIDYRLVWMTVRDLIPPAKQRIRHILEGEP